MHRNVKLGEHKTQTNILYDGMINTHVQQRNLIGISLFFCLAWAGDATAQSSAYFSGFYGGLEGGAVSYNTQITFDGVDDPAGRGGFGYGLFFGYSHMLGDARLGAELLLNAASVPDPYTFDAANTGFAALDLRRGASYGLDVRIGYVFVNRLLVFGSAGISANRQSVRLDDVPLDEFEGGADAASFGAAQLGAGLEIAVHQRVGVRFLFRTLVGRDLDIADFGSAFDNVSLTRFDVEPKQQQFFTGVVVYLP